LCVDACGEDGARVADQRGNLTQPCMRRNANKVEELTAKLRMCACSITGDASFKEWSGATARHAEQPRCGCGVKTELRGEELARRCTLRKAETH
jgi:hypothetical protein